MELAAPVRMRDDVWSPVLTGIAAPALDCMQTNLAVIADRRHGAGAHLALGGPVRFTLAGGPDGRLRVAATLDQRLAEARELLGLRVTARWDDLDGARLRELAGQCGPLYVIADAYCLAWVPYAGHRHMEHSFLLIEAGQHVTIVDGYHNDTQWGQARPGGWHLPGADFDHAVTDGATAVTLAADPPPELDVTATLAGNAAAVVAAAADQERYLAAMRAGIGDPATLEQLVLDVWLLSRARALHALWLAALPGRSAQAAAADEHAQAWQRLAMHAFLAERRAHRGQAVPVSVVDQLGQLLQSDATLAQRLAARAGGPSAVTGLPASPEPETVVLQELRAITGVDGPALDGGTELRALPGLNSFRLADLIERAEARLGFQIDPDDLTIDSLRSVSSLCELFGRAADRAAGAR